VDGRHKAGHERQGGNNFTMKIQNIEVFQVQWAPEDKPAQRSAWVRIHCDDG
jgi:hypothetical protein